MLALRRRRPDYARIARLERELGLVEPGVEDLDCRPGAVWAVESSNYVQLVRAGLFGSGAWAAALDQERLSAEAVALTKES